MPVVVFCTDDLDPRSVDPDFLAEYNAARAAGADTVLVDHHELTRGRGLSRPVRMFSPPVVAVYRGWMLRPAHYADLYRQLEQVGIRLVNTPEEYAHTHHFPNCYPLIAGNSPLSISLPVKGTVDMDRVTDLLAVFGNGPVVLKDYVKSEKHHWLEACFIPNAADKASVARVTHRFLELRGDHLNEGLVYRAFVPLARTGHHSLSGMPLSVEYRLFFVQGRLLTVSPYWEEGEHPAGEPPLAEFERVATTIRSRFFTMDIAQLENGQWTIMELGDGQVSSLPAALDPTVFYGRLVAALSAMP